MKTLIKNGTIVTAADTFKGDIFVENETVSLIGCNLHLPADLVLEAEGKYVFPGGIDVHTHLDMPFGGTTSADDFHSGSVAAAFGGTTTLIDFAIQSKGQSMREALDVWFQKAENKACVDYGFHMIVTDLADAGFEEMNALVREGVTSFKLFMAYPGVLMVDDGTIFKALWQAGKNGSLICMHAENGNVIDVLVKRALAEGKTDPKYHALTRPAIAEGEATSRAIALAQMAGAPIYIVHLSCSEALDRVREARAHGLPVYAETCPQYLVLDYSKYEQGDFEGAKYVFTPPLRERKHQEALWKGIARDDLQVVATDHCPFNFKDQKEMGRGNFSRIPNGGPGIENRLQLIYHDGVLGGRISLNRFVAVCSTIPAKLFGLYPRKGTIAVGSDADLVIYDPNREVVISANSHHMCVDYNLYEGRRIRGVPAQVFLRGKLIVDGEKFLGRSGDGRFQKRSIYTGL